jgi:hypothetical protein
VALAPAPFSSNRVYTIGVDCRLDILELPELLLPSKYQVIVGIAGGSDVDFLAWEIRAIAKAPPTGSGTFSYHRLMSRIFLFNEEITSHIRSKQNTAN